MTTNLAFSTPGFWEILVLLVLALLIFGPDKLPSMARNAGRMVARFKQEATGTLDELKRAAEYDELRGVAEELRSTGGELASTGSELQRAGADLRRSTALAGPTSASPGPDPTGEVPPFDPDAT